MTSRDRTTGQYRRALALAMILSVAIHAAVLAFVKLDVRQWAGAGDAGAETPAAVDRFAAQKPLEVVRVRIADAPATVEASAAPARGPAAAAARGTRVASFRPRPSATAPSVDLAPATPRSVELPGLTSTRADAPAVARPGSDLNHGVTFVGASEAARGLGDDRGGEGARGRRGGGFGGGISIVGAGGDCDTPATGIFDRFSGSAGAGPAGRRF